MVGAPWRCEAVPVGGGPRVPRSSPHISAVDTAIDPAAAVEGLRQLRFLY